MLTPDLSRLLHALVHAAPEADAPARILALVVADLRADGGLLYHAGQVWDAAQGTTSAAALPDMLLGLRLDRVYTAEELVARGTTATRDDLRAVGMALRDGIAWLVVSRARAPFRAAESARLAALAPHIAQALALAAQFRTLHGQAKRANLAARRMGVGILHRDTSGSLPVPDPTASELLARFGLTLSKVQALWPAVLDCEQVIALAPGLDMLVLDRAGDGDLIAMLRVQGTALPDPALVSRAMAITLPEARLARSLAQGMDMKQAALALGITEQTARFYSKQIYAKTGLSGQAALVRRIWTSALALARTPVPGAGTQVK